MERRARYTWLHDYVYLTMFKQHINLVAFCPENDFENYLLNYLQSVLCEKTNKATFNVAMQLVF